MKFECDSCHAQYMIADEKLGTRGVKVKCKRCSHVIIVRPVAASDAGDADTAERARDTFVERTPNQASPDDGADKDAGLEAFGAFGDDLDDEPTRATFAADTEVAGADAFSDTVAGAASEPRPAAAAEESTVVGPAPTLAPAEDAGLPADEENPFLKKAPPAAPDFGALAGVQDEGESPFHGLSDLDDDGGDADEEEDDGATHADGHEAYRPAAHAGASEEDERELAPPNDDDAADERDERDERAASDAPPDDKQDGSLRMDSELDADPFFGDGGGDSEDEQAPPPPEAANDAASSPDMSGADVPAPPPPDALPALAADDGAGSMPDVGGGDDLLEGELMGAFGAMFASADEGGAERGPTQVLDLGRVDQLRAESQRSEVGGPFGAGAVHDQLDQDFVGLGGQTLEGPALTSDSQLDDDEGGWHAAIDDEDVGPLTLREVGEHIKTGGVDRETLVWRPGMEDWTPAGEVREVRPLFDAVPMPRIAPSGEGAARFDVGAPIDDMGPSPFSSAEGKAEGPDPFGPIAGFDTDDNDGAWQPHGLTEVYQAANLAEAAGGLGGGAAPQGSSPGLGAASLDDDDDGGWKPGAGSALASLVSSEIERLDTPGFGESSLPPAADDSLSLDLESSPLSALSSGGLDLADDGPVGAGFGDVPTAPVPGMSGSLPPQPSLAGMPMAPYGGGMPQSGLKNPLVLIAGVGGTVIVLLFVVVLLLVFRDPAAPVVAQAPAAPAPALVPGAAAGAAAGAVDPAVGGAPAAAAAAATTPEPAAQEEPAAAARETPEAAAAADAPAKEPAEKADEPKVEKADKPDKAPSRVAAAQKRPEKRAERRVQRRQQPRQQPKPRVQQVRRTRDCDPVLDLDCDDKPLRSASSRSQKRELTPSDVLSVIKRNLRSVNACSAKYQAKGTLKMEWRILKSGNTSSVRVATPKFANTPVGDCVESAIKRWKFPAFSGKPPPPVKFPFKLKG